MPKNKTHSGASKRFKITGSGKVLRERASKRHLLEHKSSKLTRRLTGNAEMAPGRRQEDQEASRQVTPCTPRPQGHGVRV
ncbi:hypothetical protein GCM10020000_65260 [Streptomyces olivoverticillatus]